MGEGSHSCKEDDRSNSEDPTVNSGTDRPRSTVYLGPTPVTDRTHGDSGHRLNVGIPIPSLVVVLRSSTTSTPSTPESGSVPSGVPGTLSCVSEVEYVLPQDVRTPTPRHPFPSPFR